MIVESMTYEEISRTMKSDFENELIKGYNSCFGRREEFGKKALKLRANQLEYFGEYIKTTRMGNKYIFLFFTQGRHDYKMNGILRSVRLEYERKDGTHVALFDFQDLNNATFFTPHFIERVRTRLVKDEEMPLSLVRTGFFYMNHATRIFMVKNPKYKNSIFGVSPIGISLGEMITPALWEFRTFISYEMLKDDQKLLAEEGMDVLKMMEEARQHVSGMIAPNVDLKYL